MTNTPSHETQTDIENHALRAQATDYSIISKKITVTIILQTLLSVFLRVCFLEKFMNPKTVLCFFAKIGIIIKHERKVKNLKQEPTKLKFIILSFLWHWCRNIYLECGNREQIYTRFLFRSFSFPVLYCYMRNFCNLIGLEQWYFSLIWNTDMWKLQTFCS